MKIFREFGGEGEDYWDKNYYVKLLSVSDIPSSETKGVLEIKDTLLFSPDESGSRITSSLIAQINADTENDKVIYIRTIDKMYKFEILKQLPSSKYFN
ncbi:MAG: hypothetical protein WCS33_02295 [Candidatus Caldatribacteriota bacterium]